MIRLTTYKVSYYNRGGNGSGYDLFKALTEVRAKIMCEMKYPWCEVFMVEIAKWDDVPNG